MSSTVIPKEQLSAYERWELASFGDERKSKVQSAQPASEPSASELATEEALRILEQARQEAEQLREEARKQGHAEGYEKGHAAGLAAGHAAGHAEAMREAERLRAVATAFGEETMRASDAVAEDMLKLALDLAKAMLKTALKVRPELVLPVVSEAIHYLPTIQHPALLVLHPQDAAVVRKHMGDELESAGWRISEDAHMAPGGCRIETASNHIDATAPLRWKRIADALGKQVDWLE